MKPLMSALVGVAMISGSWVAVSAVAFAEERGVNAGPSMAQEANPAAAAASDAAVTCSADADAHGSSCTCARCAAAPPE